MAGIKNMTFVFCRCATAWGFRTSEERDRQKDRQINRQADRKTGRQTYRQTGRHIHTQTNTHQYKYTHTCRLARA